MGLAKFDPRASGPLLITLCAVVAFWLFWMPGLGGVSEYPELRAEAPTKALLQDSLIARASLQPGGPPVLWQCQLCEIEGTRRAWRELQTLLELYDEQDRPDFVRQALAGLPQGRAISLGSWGDRESLELVPNPLAKARGLAPAGELYDSLAGVRVIEPQRIHRVSWLVLGLELSAMLLAVPLFLRWRRLALPPRPRAFAAAQGVCLFLWCLGAASVVYRLGQAVGLDSLWQWYPLPDALAVLIVASLAFRRGAGAELTRHFGLSKVALRPVAGLTLVALGASLAWSWLVESAGQALGNIAPWAHVSPGVLVYGTDAERLVRWLSLVVTGPAFEELMFTGLLFGALIQHLSFRASALTTSIVFSLQHGYDAVGSLDLMGGSIISCWVYWRTGSLWPSIVVHGLLNASFAAPLFY